MSALQLLTRLRQAGIRLHEQDGKLKLKAPKGALTDELRSAITAQRDELIHLLQSAGGESSRPALTRISSDQPLPVSHAQQRLWFLDELEPGSAVYNMAFRVPLEGEADTQALNTALRQLLERHEVLRASYAADGSETRLIVGPVPDQVLTVMECPSAEAQAEARRDLTAEGFDLKTGPVLRAVLLKSPAGSELVVVVHHIAFDLWSADLFFASSAMPIRRL